MIVKPVLGTGIDIVDNQRMQQIMQRWKQRFLDRVFLPGEQAYCNAKTLSHIHYAARFAAKEAVAKAFGTGIGSRLGWLDIEIVKDPMSGAPAIRLSDAGQRLQKEYHATAVIVSLSHTRRFSVAHALLLGND